MRMGMRVALVAVLFVVGASGILWADTESDAITVQGVVEVVMDEDGEAVEGIYLYDEDGVGYAIALDKKGLELRDLDGEEVEVSGTLSDDGVLTVTSVKKLG